MGEKFCILYNNKLHVESEWDVISLMLLYANLLMNPILLNHDLFYILMGSYS